MTLRPVLVLTAFAAMALFNAPANASCGDRPGTPHIREVSLNRPGELVLRFQARTKHFDKRRFCYDIEVKRNNQVVNKSITGGACNDGLYGQGYRVTFSDLAFNSQYCFRMRARTEAGTQGCVSQIWSNTVCGTTSNPSFVPRR
jgi:hypothetical protein